MLLASDIFSLLLFSLPYEFVYGALRFNGDGMKKIQKIHLRLLL